MCLDSRDVVLLRKKKSQRGKADSVFGWWGAMGKVVVERDSSGASAEDARVYCAGDFGQKTLGTRETMGCCKMWTPGGRSTGVEVLRIVKRVKSGSGLSSRGTNNGALT